jgi:hypothetical protein
MSEGVTEPIRCGLSRRNEQDPIHPDGIMGLIYTAPAQGVELGGRGGGVETRFGMRDVPEGASMVVQKH